MRPVPKKAPVRKPEGRLIIFDAGNGCRELLGVVNLVGRFDFFKLRQRAQAGWLGFTGAAHAGNGKQGENGGDESS